MQLYTQNKSSPHREHRAHLPEALRTLRLPLRATLPRAATATATATQAAGAGGGLQEGVRAQIAVHVAAVQHVRHLGLPSTSPSANKVKKKAKRNKDAPREGRARRRRKQGAQQKAWAIGAPHSHQQ